MNLVPLKFVMGLRANGECDHPNLNDLPIIRASGLDWSVWVDQNGSGWLYDHSVGHIQEDAESPHGSWLGVILLPEAVANEALTAFPLICTKLTEAGLEAFYDNRHAVRQPPELVDQKVMDGLKAAIDANDEALKETPGVPRLQVRRSELRMRAAKAADPDDPEPGVKRNPSRQWATFKKQRGYVVSSR